MAGLKRSLAHGRACYSSRMRILLSNHEIKSDISLEDNERGPDGLSSCNMSLLSQPETNKMPKSTITDPICTTYTLKHQAFDSTKGYPGEGPDLSLSTSKELTHFQKNTSN